MDTRMDKNIFRQIWQNTIANLSCFQKSAFWHQIIQQPTIKSKVSLKRYLDTHFLYYVDEFLMFKNDS
jgi:hypothetical protein